MRSPVNTAKSLAHWWRPYSQGSTVFRKGTTGFFKLLSGSETSIGQTLGSADIFYSLSIKRPFSPVLKKVSYIFF